MAICPVISTSLISHCIFLYLRLSIFGFFSLFHHGQRNATRIVISRVIGRKFKWLSIFFEETIFTPTLIIVRLNRQEFSHTVLVTVFFRAFEKTKFQSFCFLRKKISIFVKKSFQFLASCLKLCSKLRYNKKKTKTYFWN